MSFVEAYSKFSQCGDDAVRDDPCEERDSARLDAHATVDAVDGEWRACSDELADVDQPEESTMSCLRMWRMQ